MAGLRQKARLSPFGRRAETTRIHAPMAERPVAFLPECLGGASCYQNLEDGIPLISMAERSAGLEAAGWQNFLREIPLDGPAQRDFERLLRVPRELLGEFCGRRRHSAHRARADRRRR